ncbi:hypothetical protein A2767_04555 [Candidatus Roizmanbacteria bacterium RIFCSPHIGHO2_01_FULL_35_10]|uniref:Uncharacterized protein n=1 Tax=Candidatus Roizmanbacteria bacterium RIFCSPLOWO2_01_FULL_35_13 TaxID=1802055 RepID=A0A1F7I729_9BACT|nr:MAG: hypothetical protein A2767_04555 [Candidatus Roizmanbacteria bacterium RIFCSPHIGHO2_01_FULL_35_10]OGK39180.1 MAG: hypothetical protein A3A74_03735 [Candidatus Roizmanbacteria bacterium RIFCSPLOWO2_01_FULL_35_13]
MHIPINKKWVLLTIFLFCAILIWIAVSISIQKSKQKLLEKKTFGYTQGVPNSIFKNNDLLIVKNKNEAGGYPFLSEKIVQIPNIHWQLRYFQPYLKAITIKNGAVFLETEFKDLNNNPKTVAVFAGGKLNNKEIPFIYFVKNGRVVRIQNQDQLKELLTLNQRINIEYLQTAENYQEAMNSDICKLHNDPVCKIAEFVNQHQNEYLKFFQTGELPDDLFLMALSILDKLNEN